MKPVFLSLSLAVLPFLPGTIAADVDSLSLSKEGEIKVDMHDFLFDSFIENRKTKFVGERQARGLKEVVVFAETREIKHGTEIDLPAGSERVATFFRHFGFHGENLDLIEEVHVFPFSPDKAPPRSLQVTDFYRVQMPTIPESDEKPAPMKIRFLMKDESATCRIDDLVFYAQVPISPNFDRIPYVDLGSDQPREPVVIDIDTEHELSIGGSSDLQRDRWFRYHETPGSTHASFQRWAYEKGFLPARGFLKFNPALTKGWGPNPETLKEREDKPGAADLTFFDRSDSGGRLRSAIPELREETFLQCFNDWPDFMSVPLKGRGTPLVERFDEAAELAAAYVADQVADAGSTSTWWEVKNESSVKSEWDHHFAPGKDGWGLLADFHNRVAEAIHAKAPGVKVGGPSSAYMQLQVKDFELYRSQARFIEETRGHLDFFSHHFYENLGMLGAHERRGSGYSNYLLGRYEACLDMLRAHMHKVDNVLPILVTETGTLQNGRRPSDNWFRLMAYSAYLNKSMQRPDQIDLFVPFIFLHMSWNPNSGDAAFAPKPDVTKGWEKKDFDPTTTAHFFDLWQDFDGRRLPVSFTRDWLDVTAVHDRNRISLAVTNMGGRQLALDLSGVAERVEATEVLQKRLNYQGGEVVFEPNHTVDASAVPVDVNETTVIQLVLEKPLAPVGRLRLDRWYAEETAVKKTGVPVKFPVVVENPDRVTNARLVVGLHRSGGITENFGVQVNGTDIAVDPGDAAEFSEFFAPLDADLPVDLLKTENEVTLQMQEGTTITSVQIVTQSGKEALVAEASSPDSSHSGHQWEVVDISFPVENLPEQPIDVSFSAIFQKGEKKIEVPGFYNGENEFVIRFTPPHSGEWKYRTDSSLAALKGRSGILDAANARKGRRGGIRVNSEAKRQFQYENEEAYFPIAYEVDWLFALDADNPGDFPRTKTFIDQMAENGFNQVVMNVFAYDVTWKKDERLKPEHEFGSPTAFPFGGSNDEPDHSQLNVGYFQRLDRVIEYLDQKGIAAHLMIYVWNKQVNWPEAKSEADNRYFDYVVRRYQAYPNLIWDVSKEALGYGRNDVTYIHDRIERLRKLDAYDRLITVHDYSYCRRFTDRVDFISVQLWGSELHSIMRKVCADMPGKPILNIEHGGYERSPYVVFEGNYTSPEVCLERAWQCVFAGTYPTHYWQGAAWNVIVPDINALTPAERPRLDCYRHMNDFVHEHDVAQLIAGEKKSASGFCLHDGESLFLFYVPKENSHIDVRLKEFQGRMMTYRWFDPFTGKYSEPVTEKIPQWPRLAVPEGDGFRILVVKIGEQA
ncbi:MAG: DUF4038 domain-containing protein [Verrucomicrobiales bacterium]|nr:DUF4038 domain-containing protein [Verrucomicrobiales bacterium]